uniref:EF-hand domain-containing protein n=2 Tax=Ciona intestinalis TaxID=7719 RepID=F6R0X3_CIOIN
MDVDGDGVISMYEMEFFYEDQMRKLEQLDIEPLPFEDCVCQMLDMVKPINRDHVTLKDLKQCKMAHVFFDTFFNVEKYLDNEQKDPFAPQKDADALLNEPSDWEKYAADEYEVLVAEEQANDHQMSLDMSYDDDIDPLLEVELKNLGLNQDRPLAEEKENNNVLETGDILEKNAEVAKGLTT